jgi:hypothetical protein
MTLRMKYFTVEEAEALIPRFTDILRSSLATKSNIEEKISDWRKRAESLSASENAVIQGQVEFLASQLEQQLGEIAESGALPKDLETGLVDFPARVENREGYLCWRLGESKITHWHGLTEGFAGRRPLQKKDVHEHPGH